MNKNARVDFIFSKRVRGSCYYQGDQRIEINLPEMMENVARDKISFEKTFSETISHELLHHLVYILEGDKASTWIDTISAHKMYKKGKEFSVKNWFGGIYGYKKVQK